MTSTLNQRPARSPRRRDKRVIRQMIEHDAIREVGGDEYRRRVKRIYEGPKGALLATCSALSLHVPLGERLFRRRRFDLRGARRILDVGSGAGQITGHLLRYADPDAEIFCTDLSHAMLRRARQRLGSDRPTMGCRRPGTAALCQRRRSTVSPVGYVLEHLKAPEPGLAEMARVLAPGGRMFLSTTEDTYAGAWTSRIWLCRTYNRRELRNVCQRVGLAWKRELWFTPAHRLLRAGGICVELQKT